ncbi:MAG: hypothetical protein JWQ55_1606 [Rhodopila sp.]|nr:hypothetical protein [Rhodopila sp.]
MIPGDEDDAAATILYGPFIEARGDDRIERLHHPGARRQAGYHFARPLAAQVGQHEFGAVLGERIRCVDEYSAVPRRQALQRVLNIRPGNGEQDIVEACGLLDRGRGRSVRKLSNLAGERFWTTSAAQDHFMASRQGLPCERKRYRACADGSELHDPPS